MASPSGSELSEPRVPPDSPGSSVSSRFQEEYDELLKYAVVVPTYDPRNLPQTLHEARATFPAPFESQVRESQDMFMKQMEAADQNSTGVDEDGQSQDGNSTMTEDQEAGFTDHGNMMNGFHDDINGRLTPSLKGLSQSTPLEHTPEKPGLRPHHVINNPDPHNDNESVVSERMDEACSFSIGIDQDMTRMELLLDQWMLDHKRNVLAEYSQCKIRTIEHHRHQQHKEREKHSAQRTELQNSIESLKELAHTYEASIQRKDQIINNLTGALQKQKEKFEMMRTFCDWKINNIDQRRETFASKVAAKHFNRQLLMKSWSAWHSVVENKWRQRVEKACQNKAQEVCMSLTNDYETKIASLNEALDEARSEVQRMKEEREKYEETMKKAFMRGVCALNMEAMTMFQSNENDDEDGGSQSGGAPMEPARLAPETGSASTVIQQEPVYTTEPQQPPQPRVVVGQISKSVGTVGAPQAKITAVNSKTKQSGRSKSLSAKVTARTDSGRNKLGGGGGTLAPPMSSVVVERHQPINKQTIGHATASQYPASRQPASVQPVISHRKIAGQSANSNVSVVSPSIHTVKVVD